MVVLHRVEKGCGMKRFRNVLLVAGLGDGPVPGYVFDRALSLARRNEGKLTLIDVFPTPALVTKALSRETLEHVLSGRRETLLRLAEAVLRRVDYSLLTSSRKVLSRRFEGPGINHRVR